MAESEVAHVLVAGRVQGVGFRWHARTRAIELGLAGWCANLPDGRVEVWCSGEAGRVDEFVAWLRVGPGAARVERVFVERGADLVALAAVQARVEFAAR